MGLSLITPIGANFIKDFPAQNAVNQDLQDAYAGPCLITHPMQSYTPALSATVTDPVLGAASVIRGHYYRIFDQIYSWGEFRFGTSASVGSGIYLITLPFPVDSLIGANISTGSAPVLGDALLYDDSADATRQPLVCLLRSTTQIMFGIRMGSGLSDREVTHNSPITWSGLAPGDGISWFVRYKRLP